MTYSYPLVRIKSLLKCYYWLGAFPCSFEYNNNNDDDKRMKLVPRNCCASFLIWLFWWIILSSFLGVSVLYMYNSKDLTADIIDYFQVYVEFSLTPIDKLGYVVPALLVYLIHFLLIWNNIIHLAKSLPKLFDHIQLHVPSCVFEEKNIISQYKMFILFTMYVLICYN